MLLLIVVALLLYRDQLKDRDPTVTAADSTEMVQKEPTTIEETGGSSEEKSNGVRVVVSVVGTRAVGLSIREDGQLVYDEVTIPGFSEEFEAEEAVNVTAAEGNAVQVAIGDENPEPLGTSGEPTTRTFTNESQSSSD